MQRITLSGMMLLYWLALWGLALEGLDSGPGDAGNSNPLLENDVD